MLESFFVGTSQSDRCLPLMAYCAPVVVCSKIRFVVEIVPLLCIREILRYFFLQNLIFYRRCPCCSIFSDTFRNFTRDRQ